MGVRESPVCDLIIYATDGRPCQIQGCQVGLFEAKLDKFNSKFRIY